MTTTVTSKNMVSIPAAVAKECGIRPGCKLEWSVVEGNDCLRVRVVPDRATLAERLYGKGRHVAHGRDLIAELDDEREADGATG
ncbi:MAG: AbrB/MazE/SpoVT family DNA-binding domain-containing protein [Armatimonadetes bacterium]|nr:AbrB/MazE/SpoVT family DNA-binding domain-containing protein [Armatimonadota bacterium]